jgi:hypothetical protein
MHYFWKNIFLGPGFLEYIIFNVLPIFSYFILFYSNFLKALIFVILKKNNSS